MTIRNLEKAKFEIHEKLHEARDWFESNETIMEGVRRIADAYIESLNPRPITIILQPISTWVRLAQDGSKLAHDILFELAARFQARHRQPPVELQSYLIEVAKEGRKKRRGRDRLKRIGRDSVIMTAVAYLIEHYGVQATRNPETKRNERPECACSVVADVLKSLKIKNDNGADFDERGIRRILERRNFTV